MGNGNQQYAMMIWLVNVVIGGALLFFVFKFVLAAPSAEAPSYVPEWGQLPDIEAEARPEWEQIEWSADRRHVATRNPDAAGFAALHRFEWNRQGVPPMPGVRPVDPGPVDPVPLQEATQAEAEADLLSRLNVVMFQGPRRVIVSLAGTDEELIMIGPLEWLAMDDRARRGVMMNDLNSRGLPMRVLEITESDWTVAYHYKNQGFTITLGPPTLEGELTLIGSTIDAGLDLQDVFDNADGSGSSSGIPRTPTNPRDPGSTNPTINDLPMESHYDEQADAWVIGLQEQLHVRRNMSSLMEDLRVRSVYNEEIGDYEGVELTNVPDQSLANQRGFVQGDVVISINGATVRNMTEIKTYLRQNPGLSEYVVVIDRAGQRITKTFRVPR